MSYLPSYLPPQTQTFLANAKITRNDTILDHVEIKLVNDNDEVDVKYITPVYHGIMDPVIISHVKYSSMLEEIESLKTEIESLKEKTKK